MLQNMSCLWAYRNLSVENILRLENAGFKWSFLASWKPAAWDHKASLPISSVSRAFPSKRNWIDARRLTHNLGINHRTIMWKLYILTAGSAWSDVYNYHVQCGCCYMRWRKSQVVQPRLCIQISVVSFRRVRSPKGLEPHRRQLTFPYHVDD